MQPGEQPAAPILATRPWGLALAAAAIAALAVLHLASVFDEFRMVAGLHRWLMTYAEGFHRRGLVGTLFQAVAGDESPDAQVALASRIDTAGTYLWLGAAFALIGVVAARTRDRALMWVALAFGAFAFLNPMWTTRIHDNGYLDWLAGLAVAGALAAFLARRPLLSGLLAATGIVAYWGTVFVWLPLGFLVAVLLLRDASANRTAEPGGPGRILAALRRRDAFALLLPPAAALLAALLHDNDAAIAELNRIGGQEHIIAQTFSGASAAMAGQAERFLLNWRAFLGIAVVFALPPALCAALWTGALHRLGRSLLAHPGRDTAAAVLATLAPLSFLIVAFDLSRLMAWTYYAFFVVAVFWLARARPNPEARRGRVWPWTAAPVALAAFFWTSPTFYAWADISHLIQCERFCFKEGPVQSRLLDSFRRTAIASPTLEFTAPAGVLPGQTGHNEMQASRQAFPYRVARAGRDQPGVLADLNILLGEATGHITLRAPAQTKNAIIGSGPHRLSIRYRAEGVDTANAWTRFLIYRSTFHGTEKILHAPLPPSKTEFSAIVTPPPELAGNPFRWVVFYDGPGALELQQVSFTRIDSAE